MSRERLVSRDNIHIIYKHFRRFQFVVINMYMMENVKTKCMYMKSTVVLVKNKALFETKCREQRVNIS